MIFSDSIVLNEAIGQSRTISYSGYTIHQTPESNNGNYNTNLATNNANYRFKDIDDSIDRLYSSSPPILGEELSSYTFGYQTRYEGSDDEEEDDDDDDDEADEPIEDDIDSFKSGMKVSGEIQYILSAWSTDVFHRVNL